MSGPVVKPGSQSRVGLTLSSQDLNANDVPESSNRTTRVMKSPQSASEASVGKISVHSSWAESPNQISSAWVRVNRTRSLNGAALAAGALVSAESGSSERSQLSGKFTASTTEPTAPGIVWIVPSSPTASVPWFICAIAVGVGGSSVMPNRGVWLRLRLPSALGAVRSPTTRRPAPLPCGSYVTVGNVPTSAQCCVSKYVFQAACAEFANDAPRPTMFVP